MPYAHPDKQARHGHERTPNMTSTNNTRNTTTTPTTPDACTMSRIIAATALRTCAMGKARTNATNTNTNTNTGKAKPNANNGNGNATMQRLRIDLQRDFATLRAIDRLNALTDSLSALKDSKADSAAIKAARNAHNDCMAVAMRPLSDAYNLVNDAVLALLDAGYAVDNDNDNNADAIRAAYRAVNASIYAHRSIKVRKTVYLQDFATDEDGNITAGDYLRVTQYFVIDCLADYEVFAEFLEYVNHHAKPLTRDIVILRLKGMSATAIGERLSISQQAVSARLKALQARIRQDMPEKTRGFKA